MKYLLGSGILMLTVLMIGCGAEVTSNETDYSTEFQSYESESGDFTSVVAAEPEMFEEEVFLGYTKGIKRTYLIDPENDSISQMIIIYEGSSAAGSGTTCREELCESFMIPFLSEMDTAYLNNGSAYSGISEFTDQYFYVLEVSDYSSESNKYLVMVREGEFPEFDRAKYFFENTDFD